MVGVIRLTCGYSANDKTCLSGGTHFPITAIVRKKVVIRAFNKLLAYILTYLPEMKLDIYSTLKR